MTPTGLLIDNQVRMYYRSGTDGTLLHRRRVDASRFHSPGSSTLLREMTSWSPSWKCDVKSKTDAVNRPEYTWRTKTARFHPDPIWNDGALGFFEEGRPQLTRRRIFMSSEYYAISLWCKIRSLSVKWTEWKRVFNVITAISNNLYFRKAGEVLWKKKLGFRLLKTSKIHKVGFKVL